MFSVLIDIVVCEI